MLVVQDTGAQQGGHALCLIGWDDNKKMFHGRNSWGTGWGVRILDRLVADHYEG